MSKGSKRRPEKGKEYADGWDRIWGKKSVDGAVAQLGERLPNAHPPLDLKIETKHSCKNPPGGRKTLVFTNKCKANPS